jgi:hypothetical protein
MRCFEEDFVVCRLGNLKFRVISWSQEHLINLLSKDGIQLALPDKHPPFYLNSDEIAPFHLSKPASENIQILSKLFKKVVISLLFPCTVPYMPDPLCSHSFHPATSFDEATSELYISRGSRSTPAAALDFRHQS